jgi:hypothetical protein
MPYRVRDLDDLLHMGKEAGDDEPYRLQEALNLAEQDGWTLLHIMDQRQLWDAEGMPDGKSEVMFVFHKPDGLQ